MNKPPASAPKPDPKAAKQERLERALRANLKRRKQATARKAAAQND